MALARPSPTGNTHLGKRLIDGLDGPFIGGAIALVVIGLIAIFSVSQAQAGGLFKKELMFLALGAGPFLFFWLTPPMLLKRVSTLIWIVNNLLLLLVKVKGSTIGGSQRWIGFGPLTFQPGEMSKIFIVITLAAFFAARDEEKPGVGTFVLSFLHVLPSALLILIQPHMGGALTIFVIWLTMCLAAKVPWRYLAIALGSVLLIGSLAWKAGAIPDYMVGRIEGMFAAGDKEEAKAKRYQQDQAMLALGNGGVTGKGFLRGTQKMRGVVPEQETDFILTVIGEEFGLLGCFVMYLAFAVYLVRGWQLTFKSGDTFARCAGLGALAIIGFHLTINSLMVLSIGPVMGLWLPFISYGGTALWLCLGITGLILNLNTNTEEGFFSKGMSRLASGTK